MKRFITNIAHSVSDAVSGPLKKVQEFAVTTILHRILIPTVLFITYFFAFGVASLFVKIFARKAFEPLRLSPDSLWVVSEGNEPDLERAKRQS